MNSTAAAIRMFDYAEQYAMLQAEIMTAVGEVFESGSLILGPRVKAFEQNFCQFLDQLGYGVGVGNGTDALAIAMRALEIGAGDEVLTVANTAIPTVSAIRMVGATPVFCDVDPRTLLIDAADAARRITSRTKAILPVHLYGNAVDMNAIGQLAAEHGLRVIEDCAQSCGTTFEGRATGTFGDVGCFSFYPTKNLGAYGDGGLAFSRDAKLADAMRRIRMYGCGKTYYSEQEGINSRLDEVQAAILDVKLGYLKAWLAKRRQLAAAYDEQLMPHVARQQHTPAADHSYHLFVIQTEHREQLLERLRAEQIGYGIHYATPIHRMSGYKFLGYGQGSLPITEQAAERVVSLPLYPELGLESIERVADVVNGFQE